MSKPVETSLYLFKRLVFSLPSLSLTRTTLGVGPIKTSVSKARKMLPWSVTVPGRPGQQQGYGHHCLGPHGMSQAPGMPGQQQGYGHCCLGRHGVSQAPGRPGQQQGYGHCCQGCQSVTSTR